MKKSSIALTCFFVIAACTTSISQATADYPTKPISLIVPLGAGGATDVVARVIAEKLSEKLGQPVVIENRPGAEGAMGVHAAAKAAPDGYTYVLGSSSTVAANYYLRKNLPFHPINDLAPVSTALKDFFNVLVINPNIPANNLKEFIALAKASPGKYNYGAATSGAKICMESFKTMAGVDLQMINYKSSPQALNDLIGGRLDIICEPVATALPNIAAGRLKAIGVTSPERVENAPELPTVSESGLPDFSFSAWVAVFSPANTPQAAIDKFSSALAVVLKDPETEQRIKAINAAPMVGNAEDLRQLLHTEMQRAEKIVRDANIQPE
ncbi:Bug family tripartite tricarboxylate transporter substrate binding protein [Parapusillimonas granuli]|uniref:Tripartite tricarboxylate transporter substrate binding protein n=1 Tax=Parapusillimonas granuli TaxID=380911 RepID=A0A853G543_9BURK|nr:tripartite tricarboxylate transporter substrate binding protein [Parapusillimonas granuli]MBB5215637.1 tripartite-type tricarboxylate transporter receptor subunit TctC [Parapusillimonas granuli]NYT49696.1 tripartite tricarboxylate transporter substrate binding protein [Parapusillimonas granuli]